MSPLRLTVRQACRSLALTGTRLMVGVSGGADSVALLRALHAERRELQLQLHVAHLNHQLRGGQADADARWVIELCERFEVPVTCGRIDVGAIAAASGKGIEEAARGERYRFLEDSARESDCQAIAVAHTADDQAETILHHILRGTGLAGLSGIGAERRLESGARLVRPMLAARRSDVVAFLDELQQDYREDESNTDEAYTRNALRRKVLPQLARDFNPRIVEALCRLGEQAAESQSVLTFCAAAWLDRVLEAATPNECRLTWQALVDCPRHLIREILSQLWRRLEWPRQGMGFEHWDRLADIVLHGGQANFPGGIEASRCGRLFTIGSRTGKQAST